MLWNETTHGKKSRAYTREQLGGFVTTTQLLFACEKEPKNAVGTYTVALKTDIYRTMTEEICHSFAVGHLRVLKNVPFRAK